MRRALGVIIVLAATTAAAKGSKERDPAFEAALEDKLRAIDPALVPVFHRATTELDAHDGVAAERDLEAIVSGAPAFSAGWRRLCAVKAELKHPQAALVDCRRAVEIEASADNEAVLAATLLLQGNGEEGAKDAFMHADHAAQLEPNNVQAQAAKCGAALGASYADALRRCSDKLLEVAPDEAASHLYASLAKAFAGDLAGGEAELERAHALGLDDGVYKELHAKYDDARPVYAKILRMAWPPLAVWLGGMLFLFALGLLLSALTLRTVRSPRAGSAHASPRERFIRRTYRAVVTLGAVYFYASIPVVALLVIGTAGGAILLTFMVGHVPIKLVLIVGAIALYTLVAMARSLTMRVKDEDPGARIDLEAEPKLRVVLEQTARSVQTRSVDAVYLVPDATLAVTERGGFFRQLRGNAERALILGVGALDGLEVRPFKAVLAHEYGHFQNQDTAGGGFALAARRSLRLMALHMAVRGVATWYNPAWWFVRAYWAIYLRISQGASRLQEVLADRWAVLAYGSAPFIAGLRHVVKQGVAFDAHANVSIQEIIKDKAPLANLYQHTPKEPAPADKLAETLDEIWNRTPSAYDSHPRPADREKWALAIGAEGAAKEPDDGDQVWSLFSDREALEKRMTALIREDVASNHGIRIAAEAPPPETPSK